MLTPILIFYVLLAGVGFGLMTIVYRLGQLRGVPVQPIIFIVSLAGVAYTVTRTWPDPFWLAPWPVWALGIGIGLSQYLLVLLIATALRHGPLSPLNCAMFLGFVLIILMARLIWHETLSIMQGIGVALATLCVVFASFQAHDGHQDDCQPRTARTWIVYAAILAGLFVLNAFSNGAFKVLGMVPTSDAASYANLYGNHYMTALYLTLGLCLGLELLVRTKPQGPLFWRLGLGIVAGLGSITGMSLLRLCASLPAAFTFPVVALTLILGGALVSVFFFGERTTRAWWAMMTSGTIAGGCLIADALIKAGR
jgi:drug/metabolite transporter (DMT)-like permease